MSYDMKKSRGISGEIHNGEVFFNNEHGTTIRIYIFAINIFYKYFSKYFSNNI